MVWKVKVPFLMLNWKLCKPCYIATFSACELVSENQIHYHAVLMINITLSLLLLEEGFD